MEEVEFGWNGPRSRVSKQLIDQPCIIFRPSFYPPQAAMDTYREGLQLFPEDKALVDGMKAAEEVGG